MKFAENLVLVETLSYYDRPMLEHWKQIDRITLTTTGFPESHEGDMFDGTIEHWCDNYFSNFGIDEAIAFAESQGVVIKFYGPDFLMVWQGEDSTAVQWLVVPVCKENLLAFLDTDINTAITLRELILREDLMHPLYLVKENTTVYDVLEGKPIQAKDLGEAAMPGSGSYHHLETFIAWELRQKGGAPTTSPKSVSLASPGEAEAVPELRLIDIEEPGGDHWSRKNDR